MAEKNKTKFWPNVKSTPLRKSKKEHPQVYADRRLRLAHP